MFSLFRKIKSLLIDKVLTHLILYATILVPKNKDLLTKIRSNISNPGKNIPLFLKQRRFLSKENILPKKVIAVFFAFEYINKSAITDYCIHTFCHMPEKFHIFCELDMDACSTNSLIQKCADQLNVSPESIALFDVANYDEMDASFNYKANIFVLGDSKFNLQVFDQAIGFFKHRVRNFLYLHDGSYLSLLYAWTSKCHYSWRELIEMFYPEYKTRDNLLPIDLLNSNKHLINAIVELTGISNFFVNAENCISIIQNEVVNKRLNIISSFLPVPDGRWVVEEQISNDNTFVIAHFGTPNNMKQLEKLILAVKILHDMSVLKNNIKLLLAGYGTHAYVASLPPDKTEFILVEDSVTPERIAALMKSVNMAVQLRWPLVGQASGIINEMIGLGLKCIATQGFINSALSDCVIEVAPDITPEQLATVILQHRNNMVIPSERHVEILNTFSHQSLANHIYDSIMHSAETKRLEAVGT